LWSSPNTTLGRTEQIIGATYDLIMSWLMRSARVSLLLGLLLTFRWALSSDETKPQARIATRSATPQPQALSFSQYPAYSVFKGKVTPPHFRKSLKPEDTFFPDGDPHCGWDDDGFYDRYYGAMKPNFAGNYIIAGCTCGSGCHYLLMWDARTGEVIRNLPVGTIDVGPYSGAPIITYAGETHRVDSNLLVLEGCFDQDAHPERRDCGRYFYLWTKGKKFAFLSKQSTRVPRLVR
jgi:hypothetical protein